MGGGSDIIHTVTDVRERIIKCIEKYKDIGVLHGSGALVLRHGFFMAIDIDFITNSDSNVAGLFEFKETTNDGERESKVYRMDDEECGSIDVLVSDEIYNNLVKLGMVDEIDGVRVVRDEVVFVEKLLKIKSFSDNQETEYLWLRPFIVKQFIDLYLLNELVGVDCSVARAYLVSTYPSLARDVWSLRLLDEAWIAAIIVSYMVYGVNAAEIRNRLVDILRCIGGVE